MFEPVELERGHLTDLDKEIRATDIPERFQVFKYLLIVIYLLILFLFGYYFSFFPRFTNILL